MRRGSSTIRNAGHRGAKRQATSDKRQEFRRSITADYSYDAVTVLLRNVRERWRRQTHPCSCRLSLVACRFAPRGAVLLEVVLAIALFVLSVGVVAGALDIAVRGAMMLKRETQAADLAVSKLAELQSLPYSPVRESPTDYDDERLDGWSYEVVVDKLDMSSSLVPPIDRVAVIIRHRDLPDFAYRLSQLVLEVLPEEDDTADDTVQFPGGGGGGGPGGGG